VRTALSISIWRLSRYTQRLRQSVFTETQYSDTYSLVYRPCCPLQFPSSTWQQSRRTAVSSIFIINNAGSRWNAERQKNEWLGRKCHPVAKRPWPYRYRIRTRIETNPGQSATGKIPVGLAQIPLQRFHAPICCGDFYRLTGLIVGHDLLRTSIA